MWGEYKGETRELIKEMKKAKAFAAYVEDGAHTSGWGRGDGKPELFAVTLTPKAIPVEGADDEENEDASKRLRYRVETAYEANKPAGWKDDKAHE